MSKPKEIGADLESTLTKLREAVSHTRKRIKELEEMQQSQILRTGEAIVANGPNGELYVVTGKVNDARRVLAFSLAVLAKNPLLFNPTDATRYCAKLTADFAGQQIDRIRTATPREFDALLLPELKEILNNTTQVLEKYEPATDGV